MVGLFRGGVSGGDGLPDWTDQGSVRGFSAGGAVEGEDRVVLGLEGGFIEPLVSVRGSGADMVGLWYWDVL